MSKLLQVNDLTTEFTGDFGKKISVDHVSFDVAEGETVCIVGESGCGKSVTSLSIMGLLGRGGAVVDGSVLFANKNLLDMDEKQLDTIRGNQMTMIFQDPLTSLNPVFTIRIRPLKISESRESSVSMAALSTTEFVRYPVLDILLLRI